MRLGFFCAVVSFSISLHAKTFPLVNAEPLRTISQAPPAIQKVSKSVVAIEMSNGSGTGFFLSDDGLLLTNRHVTGPTECPLNGCFLTLRRNWIGEPGREEVAQFFATPEFTVPELDMAILQIWAAPPKDRHLEPTEKLKTPEFLSPGADPAIGKPVFVVGHAFGGIQRWSTGNLHRIRGDWRGAEVLVVPGMSGSPVVDENGALIGVAHRSLTDGQSVLDFEKLRHVGYYTAWSAFDKFWKHRTDNKFESPLEGYVSVPVEPIVDHEVFAEFLETGGEFDSLLSLLAARRQDRIVIAPDEDGGDEDGGDEGLMEDDEEETGKLKKSRRARGKRAGKKAAAKKPKVNVFQVSDLLLQLCNAEVKSEEAMTEPEYEYHLCQAALDWFDCRDEKDAGIPIHGLAKEQTEMWDYKSCPSEEHQKKWNVLFADVGELLELKNQDPLPWLVTSAGIFEKSDARATEVVKLASAEFRQKRPTLHIFEHGLAVAAWAPGMAEKIGDKSLSSVISDFGKFPGQALFYEELLAAIQLLTERRILGSDSYPVVRTFMEDPRVPLTLKIDLENVLLTSEEADSGPAKNTSGKIRNRRSRNSEKTAFRKIRKSIDATLRSSKDWSH